MNQPTLQSVFAKLATPSGGVHRNQLSDMLTTAAICDQLAALPPPLVVTANYAQTVRPAVMQALDTLGERAERMEAAGQPDGLYDVGFKRLQRWAGDVASEHSKVRMRRTA